MNRLQASAPSALPESQDRRQSRAALRWRWRRICRAMLHPHFELMAEEFAEILSTYKLLRLAGETFDPTFIALMAVLERQLVEGSDDSDCDVDVADYENEDPDAERDDPDEDGADERLLDDGFDGFDCDLEDDDPDGYTGADADIQMSHAATGGLPYVGFGSSHMGSEDGQGFDLSDNDEIGGDLNAPEGGSANEQ